MNKKKVDPERAEERAAERDRWLAGRQGTDSPEESEESEDEEVTDEEVDS